MIGSRENMLELAMFPLQQQTSYLYSYFCAGAVGTLTGVAMRAEGNLWTSLIHVVVMPAFFLLGFSEAPLTLIFGVYLLCAFFYGLMTFTFYIERRNEGRQPRWA